MPRTATEQALQSEIDRLRGELAKASADIGGRKATEQTLRGQLDSSRERVSQLLEENAGLVARNARLQAENERLAEREGMRGLLADVANFHRLGGAPVLSEPTVPALERVLLRGRLVREEFDETMVALGYETIYGDVYPPESREHVDLVELADGLADLIFVLCGTALETGIPLDAVWREVCRSNLSKFPAVIREDGNILKAPHYSPPRIREAVFGEADV